MRGGSLAPANSLGLQDEVTHVSCVQPRVVTRAAEVCLGPDLETSRSRRTRHIASRKTSDGGQPRLQDGRGRGYLASQGPLRQMKATLRETSGDVHER